MKRDPKRCECGRLMEPTLALAFFYPQLRDKAEAFPWACRDCRIVASEPS